MKQLAAAAVLLVLAASPALAWSSSLSHLQGVWSQHGQVVLEARGYQTVWTVDWTTYWWNVGERRCIKTVEQDGYYVSLDRVPPEMCYLNGR